MFHILKCDWLWYYGCPFACNEKACVWNKKCKLGSCNIDLHPVCKTSEMLWNTNIYFYFLLLCWVCGILLRRVNWKSRDTRFLISENLSSFITLPEEPHKKNSLCIVLSRHKQDCVFWDTKANLSHETSFDFQAWWKRTFTFPSFVICLCTVSQQTRSRYGNNIIHLLCLHEGELLLIFKFACSFGHLS